MEVVGQAVFTTFPGEDFRFSVRREDGIGCIRLENQGSKCWSCIFRDVGAFTPAGVMLPPDTVLHYVAASLKRTTTSDGTNGGLNLIREDGDRTLQLEVLIQLGVVDATFAPKYVFPMTLVSQQNAPPSEQVEVLTAQVYGLQQEVKTLKDQMTAVLRFLEKSVMSSWTSPGFTICRLPSRSTSVSSPSIATRGNAETPPTTVSSSPVATRESADIPSTSASSASISTRGTPEIPPKSVSSSPTTTRGTAEIPPTSSRRERQWSEVTNFTDHKLVKHYEYREKINASGAIERKNRQHSCKVCSALRGDRQQPFRTCHYCVQCTEKREGSMVFLCDKVRPHEDEDYRNATCNQIWHALWNNGDNMPESGVVIRMRKKLRTSKTR